MARPLLIPNPHNARIEELKQVSRVGSNETATFWTAKAFHGYISKQYQIECSYETVVRFFPKQGDALKTPQPWSDQQDERLREAFLQQLEQLFNQPDRANLAEDQSNLVQ